MGFFDALIRGLSSSPFFLMKMLGHKFIRLMLTVCR